MDKFTETQEKSLLTHGGECNIIIQCDDMRNVRSRSPGKVQKMSEQQYATNNKIGHKACFTEVS